MRIKFGSDLALAILKRDLAVGAHKPIDEHLNKLRAELADLEAQAGEAEADIEDANDRLHRIEMRINELEELIEAAEFNATLEEVTKNGQAG